ncbi:hypothetical protein MEG_01905 [Bartonella tamiae Th307]|uniref:Uncharacterized protein n=1 Tax=Bartonella tamiae Th239 TaxID=1094558 RepID=J1JXQ7_9HYPH|nr:hypothetical protein ME5_01951 [Bartonella tamiae Th239]EJF92735.1 hypothetical protein MEG_01905 [Bartonella tamiae Th307]
MKTSIATVSIAGTVPEQLEAISKAGFDGAEIFEMIFLHMMLHLKRWEIWCVLMVWRTLFQSLRDFEGIPEPYRYRTFERAKKFDIWKNLAPIWCWYSLIFRQYVSRELNKQQKIFLNLERAQKL